MAIIKTERLVLRPFELSDLDTMHEYEGDKENNEYMIFFPNDTKEKTEDGLQKIVAEWNKEIPQHYEFAVTLNNRHIGAVSVTLDENRQVGELGWIIQKSYNGNGYATEAAKAIIDFSFSQLKLKKVFANCDYRNEASLSVMKKIGLCFEKDDGVRRYNNSDENIQELTYSLEMKTK
jgi:RimJ/RimL family protein N-acetyltransferase